MGNYPKRNPRTDIHREAGATGCVNYKLYPSNTAVTDMAWMNKRQ